MFGLIADNFSEILRHGSSISRLMLAYTCKQLLPLRPDPKLPTDKLLLGVIEEGSITIYDYYYTKEMIPVWYYLVGRNSVRAYIGAHVSLESKKWLRIHFDFSWQVVIEFAILSCSLQEIEWYHSFFRLQDLATRRDLHLSMNQRLRRCTDLERNDIIRITEQEPTNLQPHQNVRGEWRWSCRHGKAYSDTNYSQVGFVSYMDECLQAVMFGNNEFYFSEMAKDTLAVVAHFQWNEHLWTAIGEENIDVVTFVLPKVSKPAIVTFTEGGLILGIVTLLLPHLNIPLCSVNLEVATTFWSKEQKECIRILSEAGCRIISKVKSTVCY